MIIELGPDTVKSIKKFLLFEDDVKFKAIIPDKFALIENISDDNIFIVATSGKLGFLLAVSRTIFAQLLNDYTTQVPKGEHETTTDTTSTDSSTGMATDSSTGTASK